MNFTLAFFNSKRIEFLRPNRDLVYYHPIYDSSHDLYLRKITFDTPMMFEKCSHRLEPWHWSYPMPDSEFVEILIYWSWCEKISTLFLTEAKVIWYDDNGYMKVRI